MKATVIYYDRWKPCKESTIEGETEHDIFETYVNWNDTLKYCNGSYYKWKDEEWEKAYRKFLDGCKGNFFLNCAVRRGVLID